MNGTIVTDTSTRRDEVHVTRWRRLALVGWSLLLLALACGGVTEHLEQLFVERVKVSTDGSRGVTNIAGGEIIVADAKGNRVVISPTGIELFDARGRRSLSAPSTTPAP